MGVDFKKVDWASKLEKAGIVRNYPRLLTRKHGPCPICKEGTDRFRFDNKMNMGTWWCQHCGAGNGYTLLLGATGWSPAEVMKFLDDGTVGQIDALPLNTSFQDEDFSPEKVAKNRKTLQWAFRTSQPLNGRDPASVYLQKRVPGCDVTKLSRALRFHPGMDFWESDALDKPVRRGRFPTLLAQAIDGEMAPITGHRTFLTAAGDKAPFKMVKKQMKGVRKLDGAAIRVVNVPESRVLALTEGIENAVAVATGYRYKMNVWSLLNCGNLELADIPEGQFDKIIIFADHDAMDLKKGHRPGEHHARQLKARLEATGYEVELKIPPVEGTDFADLWIEYYHTRRATLAQKLQCLQQAEAQHDNDETPMPVPASRVPATTQVMNA